MGPVAWHHIGGAAPDRDPSCGRPAGSSFQEFAPAQSWSSALRFAWKRARPVGGSGLALALAGFANSWPRARLATGATGCAGVCLRRCGALLQATSVLEAYAADAGMVKAGGGVPAYSGWCHDTSVWQARCYPNPRR